MKILIRTGGGRNLKKELGTGHIIRCLNLANKLKKRFDVVFLLEDYGGATEIIQRHGFKTIFQMKKNPTIKTDLKKTLEIIKKERIQAVIVDRYKMKIGYLKTLKKFVKLIVISDLKNMEYPGDLVVNGFIGYKNGKRTNSFGSLCLIGPAYQIINEKFAKKPKHQKKIKLLITFGGLDGHNIVDKIIEPIDSMKGKIKMKIILGFLAKKTPRIEMLQNKYKNSIKVIQKTNNMFKEIVNAEFGLCSGGLTTYEFASQEIPFGIISQVNHQLITAKAWTKTGLAENLGLVNDLNPKKVEMFFKKIASNSLKLKPRQKIRLVDGKGSERVSTAIAELISVT